jgi:diaminopimelate decarboxylase
MNPWSLRDGLEVVASRLRFAGHDAERLAREHGTPLYVYDPERLQQNVQRLRGALERAAVRYRLNYALKANRHPQLLAKLRAIGDLRIDVCSPGEVTLALESG